LDLILNADDFGVSEETVRATIECFEQGALTSATIMAGMPAAESALKFASQHPERSFGVHLTFVTDGIEHPLADPASIPDLLGADGRFLPTATVRQRAVLHRLPVKQIEKELEAQLAFVRDHGVPISHVDSHRHVHKLAPFRAALRNVLPRFGLGRVRNVQDVYLRRSPRGATFWLGPLWRRQLMRHFMTTDHFYMPRPGENRWHAGLLALTAGLRGSLEVGVHPGYDETRDPERRSVQELADGARANGHRLISWNDLRSFR